jgi:hypothetical protein
MTRTPARTINASIYLNGARVAQMSNTQPLDLDSASLGIGRHASGIADPFNGHIDEFRIAHVQRSDGWIVARKRLDFIQGSWRGVEHAGLRFELLHREVDEGAKAG